MTIIGKILTFLIFVFSLLFLGFAIIINNTNKDPRTKQSWYEQVQILKASVKNHQDDLKVKMEELDSYRSQLVNLGKELQETKSRAETEKAELINRASVAENAKDAAVTKLQQNQVALGVFTADLEKKTKETLDLSDRLKQADITKADLNSKLAIANNTRVAAQIELQAVKNRLAEAEGENTRLAREIENIREQKMQQTNLADLSKPQPPPVDVQGKVTGVTSDGLYIEINGLAKNQTLEVYRLSPKADWVARIRIIQVSDHSAVGIIVLPQNRKVTILKDDLVGSSILPGAANR
jgi:chromosome segregation ATPase